MSLMCVSDKYIAVGQNLQIDLYNRVNHKVVGVPTLSKHQVEDRVNDIIISSDDKILAVITSVSKQLVLFELPDTNKPRLYSLPRSASKIRFDINNTHILVADKTGDILVYNIKNEDMGTKLLGHLSLLLDVLQTNDGRFIITSDRDEKIKVSCYPNTYNIQTYCLGHKEFVNHIELLPHNDKFLVSSSGDGTIKIWEILTGKCCCTIHTYKDIEDNQLKDNFAVKMDEEGIEIDTLPIVHLIVSKLDEITSLIASTVHTYNAILIYRAFNEEDKINHILETQLKLDSFPTSIQFFDSKLYIYNDVLSSIIIYMCKFSEKLILCKDPNVIKTFENVGPDLLNSVENHFECIKLLYKRKFDNVQEYLERKKQRLEKMTLKN